jgi:hypothetical protein
MLCCLQFIVSNRTEDFVARQQQQPPFQFECGESFAESSGSLGRRPKR